MASSRRPTIKAAATAATLAAAPLTNPRLLNRLILVSLQHFRRDARTGYRLAAQAQAERELDKKEKDWPALLAAAQRGEVAAYRAFLQAVLPFARAIARRHVRDEEVEDAVQDALLTLHRVRHTYQPGRPVEPWLAAIVARRAIDLGRRRGRIGRREVSDPHAYETFPDARANREKERDARGLAAMMADLPPKQREALELVKLKEMTLAEASARSGQSIASLKVNVHRALRRLQRRAGGETE